VAQMINWKLKLIIRESTFTAVVFTFASYSYYIIAFWGIEDHYIEGPLKTYMTSPFVHVELLLVSLLFGVLIGLINRITETPKLRRKSAVYVVLFRTSLYLISLVSIAAIVLLFFIQFIFSAEKIFTLFSAITPQYGISFIIWIILIVGLINFLLEIERIIGQGNMWRLFIGMYRRPLDEERIFLFMDLKGSTKLAEKLGPRQYSMMLQECYRDLTAVVLRYSANIYQYVGDEVVISWPYLEKQKMNAINTFFQYRKVLYNKRDYYLKQFGEMPEFRGGISAGSVIVSEVGDVKREIAYHGDVLNTASRLLELCKMHGGHLYVSKEICTSLKGKKIETELHENLILRGKSNPVEVFGLKFNDNSIIN
jgi:adenylate cyclase